MIMGFNLPLKRQRLLVIVSRFIHLYLIKKRKKVEIDLFVLFLI